MPDSSEAALSVVADGDDANSEGLDINLRRELSLLDEVTLKRVISGEVLRALARSRQSLSTS
jgi:hypothetical protein